MSATLPPGDRRPIPAVAIVGNDTVLAAAPATPVQLAHACLRRGFAVAVPASWGDELVAAEAVRRLAARGKGPAVMCACPYVRAHLLAPGTDLAPFLVSLVAPPVAAARYLRTVYGEHGVHITYIGGCPAADDPAIDVRLTPDQFLADLAERTIALSEQPLVFDSIVPPDRRRWCSLPGGAPSAEVLWNETDSRTLVELDRNDVSTDLAQQIMTREHVLLDLAPSLGCACSGAVPSLPPRSARVAVSALEPPRAFGPVIDPAAVVPLDAPVGLSATLAHLPRIDALVAKTMPGDLAAPADVQDLLDHEIGRSSAPASGSLEPMDAPAGDSAADASLVETASARVSDASVGHPPDSGSETGVIASTIPRSGGEQPRVGNRDEPAVEVPPWAMDAEEVATPEARAPADPSSDVDRGSVRRRTPPSLPMRHLAASIPRTSAGDGRSLPRAYVARRRTPTSVALVAEAGSRTPPIGPALGSSPDAPSATNPPRDVSGLGPTASPTASPRAEPPTATAPAVPQSPATASPVAAPSSPSTTAATGQVHAAGGPSRTGAVATPATNRGVLSILLISALMALFAYVVAALRR
jgi:hypothetical protein